MKDYFTFYRLKISKYSILLIVFLLYGINAGAQTRNYKDGIKKGIVKVKFEESMTNTLGRMQISTKGNQLSTGIKALDNATKTIKALHMERLIPECRDVALEAKHRRAGLHLWYVIKFDENVSPQQALNILKMVEGIKEANFEFYKKLPPMKIQNYIPGPSAFATGATFNDPFLKDQWHYNNTGQVRPTGERADVNLAEAWKKTAGRPDIIVSVHDEGVDFNHEDLKANMWVNTKEIPGNGEDDDGNGYIDDIHGFNFVDLTGDIQPMPHGTHVAGTIAAVNNNGIGVAGVAGGTGIGDGVKIMSLQILDGAEGEYIMRSYVYAADMGAVISQNSWGYSIPGVYEPDVMAGIDYFIKYAGDYPNSPMKGGLVVFAAGNDNMDDLFYPGYYDQCLTVAAIGPEWKKSEYSNYGKWVEISAPGGDMVVYDTAKAGVLSTLPKNQYGFIHGTSMAAPHVSGIAALTLSNSQKQLTNKELWSILITSVKDVDIYNPNYVGKLGAGAIDAALAVSENKGIAPDQITNLKVKGIAQEFAELEWKVPADEDDGQPHEFFVYYSKENITSENVSKAQNLVIENRLKAGETTGCFIENLSGTTKYYFAIISADRWGNKSQLSNIATASTNTGPTIDVNTGTAEILLSLVASIPQAIAKKTFELINASEGTLRWNTWIGNTGFAASPVAYNSLPVANVQPKGIKLSAEKPQIEVVQNQESKDLAMDFLATVKRYVPYTSIPIGDSDPRVPTAGALKFSVKEDAGFNLTKIAIGLEYTQGTGPVVIHVYDGKLAKANLVRAEAFTPENSWTRTHEIELKEHCYFEKGKEFFIAVFVPGGNGHSLAVGTLETSEYEGLSLYSSNNGEKWQTFAEAGIPARYAWNIAAMSQYENITQLIDLTPDNGTLFGNSKTTIEASVDISKLINGTYKANVVFETNDSKNPQYRVPVDVKVAGQKPNMVYPNVVDFGSVFLNAEKTLDILLENYGYGLIQNLTATVNNPAFELSQVPGKISARTSQTIRVKYKPTIAGANNAKLTVTNGSYSFDIALFGVGAETSKMEISPLINTLPNIRIGDIVSSDFTIKNNGKFPLTYFIPGYDNKNIGKDFSDYHKYGYAIRSNDSKISGSTLDYDFKDISATGVDISSHFIDEPYYTLKLAFSFPFYGEIQEKIFITNKGFTVFDDSAYPWNAPTLKTGLKGYISLFGYDYFEGLPKVHYREESDHLIIQYTDVNHAFNDPITAQMVLYSTGDIHFYYKKAPTRTMETSPMGNASFLTILIEDVNQSDGILVRDQDSEFLIESGTAIGFDYPGPNIIKEIENGSGVVAPGESVIVKMSMDTKTLREGQTKRYANIVSNDPLNQTVAHAAILDITSGGVLNYEISTDKVDFGVIYKDSEYSKEFSIKNPGSQKLGINNISFNADRLAMNVVSEVKAGISQLFKVEINTSVLGAVSEKIKFEFADGKIGEVTIVADVRNAPDVNINLDLISAKVAIDGKSTSLLEATNTGDSPLDISIIGGQWFSFVPNAGSILKKEDYLVKKENSGEPSYKWVDITETGKKLPSDDKFTGAPELFWKEVELPFKFPFYGTEFSSLKVSDNGNIAFGEGYPRVIFYADEQIPVDDPEFAFIFPMWSAGAFDIYNFPDEAGIYVQTYDDKIIITWQYYANFHGWGQSGQALLFADGTIKFQYKTTEGTVDGSDSAAVAIQDKGGKNYKMISYHSSFDYEKGLAYMIMPDKTYEVEKGEKLKGNIVLDATNIYGGKFTDEFLIKTNIPTKPEIKKPVELEVDGAAEIVVPSEIDLGETEVVFDEYMWAYKSLRKTLKIANTGTAPVRITGARMEKNDQYLTLLIPQIGPLGLEYIPVDQAWEFPQQFVLPGGKYEPLLGFTPEDEGNFEDTLILETSEGELKVKMKGFAYYPPSINVDDTPIDVSMIKLTDTEKRSFEFNNNDGGYKLDYNVAIRYKRGSVAVRPLENRVQNKSDKKASEVVLNPAKAVSIMPLATTYADPRIIKYFEDKGLNSFMGNHGETATHVATRFTADNTGFNLSNILPYIQLKKGQTGTITVEVRAGGDHITTAITLAKGEQKYSFPESVKDNEVIMRMNIELEKEVQIMPYEDFYVIVSFPFDLEYPQPIQLGGVEIVKDRYLWFDGSAWVDLQEYVAGYDPASGYAMYVAEHNFNESGWLKVLSPESGTLKVGDKSKVELNFVGSLAKRGTQEADVVIKSSDVNASIVKVPVSLHLNEAPQFINAPTSLIISEKETAEIEIEVIDPENNKFTVEVLDVPEFITATITATLAIQLAINPDYGDEGNYVLILKATDEHSAVNEHILNVHVAKTNRAPEFIGNLLAFKLSTTSKIERFNVSEYFMDPDGDKFTVEVSSKNTTIVEAYQSGSDQFILEPKKQGQTELVFVLTDVHGASATITIAVTVDDCLAPESLVIQMWNNALVVNNPGGKYIAYQWYKNGIKIEGATKQYYGESNQELDAYAQYYVELTNLSGKVEVSCPIRPVKHEISIKAYPNPVRSGEMVTVVTQLPDLNVNPITIQVINMNGQILQTISTKEPINTINMPYGSGVYVIKVFNKVISKSFKVVIN